MRIALLWIACACSSSSPAVRPPQPAPRAPAPATELGPALAPLAWLVGDWTGPRAERWVASTGVLFGIAFAGDRFEVMVIDDGEGPGKPDGVLRFVAIPRGARMIELGKRELGDRSVTFANDSPEFPSAITYRREGDTLAGAVTGGGRSEPFTFTAEPHVAAPELEAADRAFSDATGARGVDGWADAFDDHGAMLRKSGRIEGRAAIADAMRELLGSGTLAWSPIASGARGDFGFTVGIAAFTGAEHWRSTYVTIWHRQPAGGWKVWFDTGRMINE